MLGIVWHLCAVNTVDLNMRAVPLTAIGQIPSELFRQLASELSQLLTLADVFTWARRTAPPRQVEEIVTQDEYTHDVVLALDGRRFLVFDAT